MNVFLSLVYRIKKFDRWPCSWNQRAVPLSLSSIEMDQVKSECIIKGQFCVDILGK